MQLCCVADAGEVLAIQEQRRSAFGAGAHSETRVPQDDSQRGLLPEATLVFLEGYVSGTGQGATTQECFDSSVVQNIYNEAWPQFYDVPPSPDNGWIDEDVMSYTGVNTTPDWCGTSPPFQQFTALLSFQSGPRTTYHVPSTQHTCVL